MSTEERPLHSGRETGFPYKRRVVFNSILLLLAESLAITLSLMLAGLIRYWLTDAHIPPSRGFWLIPAWCVGAVFFRLVPGWGNGPVEELRRIQILLVAVFGIATAAMFLSKTASVTSRIKFASAYALCIVAVPVARMVIKTFLVKRKWWGIPAVIYGTDETATHVLNVLLHEPGLGYMPVGIFDNQTPAGQTIQGVPVLGGMDDSTQQAVVAILGPPSIPREQLACLLEGPLSRYLRVIIIPDLLDIPSLWVNSRDFMGALGLEVTRNLLNPIPRYLKSDIDLFLTVVLLPIWLPLGLILTYLVWREDRASPFYFQERIGRNGKKFKTWKFRSMIPDAEKALQQQMDQDASLMKEWKKHCKLKDDPRITRIGRFLRRSSLDELPQLVNVLRGEMALVGPRPLPEYHYAQLKENVRMLRDQVHPGITGLWQVSGRSESGTEGMERWDSYYVRNWSLWLDAIILVRTIRAVMARQGAY